jgi:FHA domain
MTEMKITRCVPLPGKGLVTRQGDLIAVTEGGGPGPDPLLDALEEVAATTGDGGALVLAVARALLANPDQVSGACAGIMATGEVAVLVHGSATAAIVVDGGQEVELTSKGSMLPVSRTFSGTAVTIRLALGTPRSLDARLWLDSGVVYGSGLTVTASADPASPGMMMSPAERPADRMTSTTAARKRARRQPSAQPPDAGPSGAQPGAPGGQADGQPAYVPAGQDGDLGQAEAEGSHPPIEFMLAAPPVSQGREPSLHQPDAAANFEWISLAPQPVGPDGHDHGQDVTQAAPEEDMLLAPEGAQPAMVEGVLCARIHFNDPDVAYCRQCGISMVQQTRRNQLGQRPPLGVLLLDDGMGFTLDRDYVLGREPVLDGDVIAGRARPLRITDPDGTVGRVHLRVSLVGWQVEVKDLGSVNGSVIYFPDGGEEKLKPSDPVVIAPGTRIGVGHRSIQYLSYRAG